MVLNRIAKSVLEQVRGSHPEYVFTYLGHAVRNINNSTWKRVRKEVGLPLVRVHDLKHTFGHRLRAAGVPLDQKGVARPPERRHHHSLLRPGTGGTGGGGKPGLQFKVRHWLY